MWYNWSWGYQAFPTAAFPFHVALYIQKRKPGEKFAFAFEFCLDWNLLEMLEQMLLTNTEKKYKNPLTTPSLKY